MLKIVLYTDGSSRGNPGPGGYGAILMSGTHRKELSQGFRLTTNNRMELMAVIAGLEAIKKNELPITVYSDSQYVVNAVEKGWLKNWIKTDFKGGKKNKKKRGKMEFCVCACAYKQPGIAFGGNEGTCAASSDAYPPVRLRTHV